MNGQAEVIAETNKGKVKGLVFDGVNVFRGIPYGAPTGGENRFKAPKPREAWSDIFDATNYGPTAPQRSHAEMAATDPEDEQGKQRKAAFAAFLHGLAGDEPAQSEDCLRLNVWTSGINDKKSRAVMVWLHGGAFESGSGSWPMYDGTPLAQRDDVVVVTINHRLGVLGYLFLDELGGEEYQGSGNAGMLDIVQALQWVRDNIEKFGGDPAKVMVFGGSGGASKTSTLLAMPSAQGLFQRGALLSGPLLRVRTKEMASDITHQLLTRLGLTINDIGKLHDIPYEKLLAESAHLGLSIDAGLATAANPEEFMPMQPVVDGVAIPVQPMDPVASPYGGDVAMIVGSTKDDMKMMMLSMPWFGKMDDSGLEQFFKASFGSLSNELIVEYNAIYPDASASDIACQSVTDRIMWMGAVTWAERKSADIAPVYVYRFDFETPIMGGLLGATHGGDIPFAMNNYTYTPMAGERQENKWMGGIMSESFVQFAHTGNPNHRAIPNWQPYSLGDRPSMIFDVTCREELDSHANLRKIYQKNNQ